MHVVNFSVFKVPCCCRILSVGGDGMFAEVVHGLLTHVLKATGSDQPSVDTILPQPKWRIGIIPAGRLTFSLYSCLEENHLEMSFVSRKVTCQGIGDSWRNFS